MTAAAPPSQRIDSVDGLRAVALLAVFAFHTWEFAGRPDIPVVADVVAQNIRPDFFVVLTGFVLFLPFARRPERMGEFDTRAYVRRRLRRIVLPYYVALLFAVLLPQVLVVLMRALGREASWQPFHGPGDWLSHLTFTHLFFVDYWDSINGSLWTMSLEMQLYLLFPVVLLAVARWGFPALVGAALASVAFRVLVELLVSGPEFPDRFLWGASGVGRLMEMAAGMMAATVAFRVVGRLRGPHVALTLGLMLCSYWVATASWSSDVVLPVRELGLGLLFGGLIVLVLAVPRAGWIFSRKPFTFIGYRSYSLFLIHQPTAWYVSEFAQKFLDVPEGSTLLVILWTVGFGVVLAFGQLLFITVERPCIDWAKRTYAVPRPRQGVPEVA